MRKSRAFMILTVFAVGVLFAGISVGEEKVSVPVLDHIGIAVKDIDTAVEAYLKIGFSLGTIKGNPAFGMKNTFMSMETGKIEIVQPVSEESPIAKFLTNKGPGLHHIAFRVNDIQAELKRLEGTGITLVNSKPTQYPDGSQVAFIHPQSTSGVIIQLIQYPK